MKPSTILAFAAPLLLVQGRYVRRVTPKLPEAAGPRSGERRIASEGARRERLGLLIAGDSSAAGVGASHQDDALPGCLSDALARRRSAATIDWKVVARSGADTRDLLAMLEASAIAPFDVAVVAVGVNDVTGRRPVGAWLRDFDRVLDRLRESAPDARVLVSGLPPMHRFPALPQPLRTYLGARAREFDAALEQWSIGRDRVRHVGIPDSGDRSLVAGDGFHPGPGAYRIWAEVLADVIDREACFAARVLRPVPGPASRTPGRAPRARADFPTRRPR